MLENDNISLMVSGTCKLELDLLDNLARSEVKVLVNNFEEFLLALGGGSVVKDCD
jgi:hypothetical protein